MKNLLDEVDLFDEESQRILRAVASSGKVLDFQNQTSNLKNVMIDKDSPDYRSAFHNYANTPFGYSYLTDNPVSTFPSTGINENGEKGIEYYAEVLPCKNGSEVYGSYQKNARKKQALFLFYERPDTTKSNFAGPFYIAKMGDYFVSMFKNFPKPLPSKINGKFFKDITSLKDEASYLTQLAYTYEKDKIDATAVYQALLREYQFLTNDKQLDELLGNISAIPADAIGWCADKLENLKPTEKNYNPETKDYTPIIPVLGVPIPVNMNKAAQFFENLGDNPFVQGADAAFTKVWDLVKQAASKVKDVSIEHLPESFRNLVNKISGIIGYIRDFLSDVKGTHTSTVIEILKLSNAFYCGILNGLISLVQCVLYILEFLLQPTKTFSYKQYLERRDLLEKAEDVIDWINENVPKFLQGVKDLFSGSGDLSLSDMEGVMDKMKEYFGNISRYTVAFYVGVLAFEVLINVLLLIFTEGVGNVVKGATYVKKATNLLWVLTRETFSAATLGITDLLLFLGKFVIRFTKACAKGFKGFVKFIEELLTGAKNGSKADDLVEEAQDIEEVILKGRKLQKGGGDINKTFAENAGIKIERWLSESKVFGQSKDYTCASTSLRMVLDDKGIIKSEEYLAKALNTDKNGASILDIPEALHNSYLDDVTAIAEEKIKFSNLLKKLEEGDKAVVSIFTKDFGSHAVIIDKVENGKVFLRDPLPMNQGSFYSMEVENFKKIFKQKAVIIKK